MGDCPWRHTCNFPSTSEPQSPEKVHRWQLTRRHQMRRECRMPLLLLDGGGGEVISSRAASGPGSPQSHFDCRPGRWQNLERI